MLINLMKSRKKYDLLNNDYNKLLQDIVLLKKNYNDYITKNKELNENYNKVKSKNDTNIRDIIYDIIEFLIINNILIYILFK